MVKCCVFFAVRTEFLNIIETSFGFKWLTNIPKLSGKSDSDNKSQDNN
jgi:hypothetical protein